MPRTGSSESKKPQAASKTPNVSGTAFAFNLEGEGTDVQVEGATFNTGYGTGNPNHRSDDENLPEGIGGTYNAFNVSAGAKFNGKGATFNTGAGSGHGAPQKKHGSELGRTTGTKGKHDSNSMK